MTEYAQDDESVNLTTLKINRADSFTNTGYMVQATYYLTGENASYSTVSPLARSTRVPEDGAHGS